MNAQNVLEMMRYDYTLLGLQSSLSSMGLAVTFGVLIEMGPPSVIRGCIYTFARDGSAWSFLSRQEIALWSELFTPNDGRRFVRLGKDILMMRDGAGASGTPLQWIAFQFEEGNWTRRPEADLPRNGAPQSSTVRELAHDGRTLAAGPGANGEIFIHEWQGDSWRSPVANLSVPAEAGVELRQLYFLEVHGDYLLAMRYGFSSQAQALVQVLVIHKRADGSWPEVYRAKAPEEYNAMSASIHSSGKSVVTYSSFNYRLKLGFVRVFESGSGDNWTVTQTVFRNFSRDPNPIVALSAEAVVLAENESPLPPTSIIYSCNDTGTMIPTARTPTAAGTPFTSPRCFKPCKGRFPRRRRLRLRMCIRRCRARRKMGHGIRHSASVQ
ncbi:VPS34 [Symbiodinium natans]|uniref:VPS34 protein n=1 Tax=Symbiodinium natans TaxID=878477 RepID=A0A812SFU3_9DINO|nr:VPS34 [Symbiodinium natans]